MMGLRLAEQSVGNAHNRTFRSLGSPARRTQHHESKKRTFRNYGTLWLAEPSVGNLKKTHFRKFWYSGSQNKTLEISKETYFQKLWDSSTQHNTSEILGLWLAELATIGAHVTTQKSKRKGPKLFTTPWAGRWKQHSL